MKPKTWTSIYPQGTKEGDEEQLFFIGKDGASGLARHPKYEWRSTAAIAKESGLSQAVVERILQKYVKLGLIFPSTSKDDHWAYWERVPEKVAPPAKSVAQVDQDNRMGNLAGQFYGQLQPSVAGRTYSDDF